MPERRRLVLLILVMAAVAVMIGASAIYLIYQGGIDRERLRLQDIVQSQARLLEALARFDQVYSAYPAGPEAGSIAQFIESHRTFAPRGMGRSGELVLALSERALGRRLRPLPVGRPPQSRTAAPHNRVLSR